MPDHAAPALGAGLRRPSFPQRSETGWRIAAFAVFAIAASPTGSTVSWPAPRLITEFGKLADPIADKALIGLRWSRPLLDELPWWVTWSSWSERSG
jgi:hypothetical protein